MEKEVGSPEMLRPLETASLVPGWPWGWRLLGDGDGSLKHINKKDVFKVSAGEGGLTLFDKALWG